MGGMLRDFPQLRTVKLHCIDAFGLTHFISHYKCEILPVR